MVSGTELSMVKYATSEVSVLNVSVRGLSVLWSLQWLNLYPGLAVAEKTVELEKHEGGICMVTTPIVVSLELNNKEGSGGSN